MTSTADNNATPAPQNPNGTMRMSIIHQCTMPRCDEFGTAQPTDPTYTARFIITDSCDSNTSVAFTACDHRTMQEATHALAEKLRNCARLIDIAIKGLEES